MSQTQREWITNTTMSFKKSSLRNKKPEPTTLSQLTRSEIEQNELLQKSLLELLKVNINVEKVLWKKGGEVGEILITHWVPWYNLQSTVDIALYHFCLLVGQVVLVYHKTNFFYSPLSIDLKMVLKIKRIVFNVRCWSIAFNW